MKYNILYMKGLDIKKGKIAIIGFGVSGRSIARFFLKHNTAVDVFEDKKESDFNTDSLAEYLSSNVFKIYFADSAYAYDVTQYDYVVVSPGVHNDHPLIISAGQSNIEYITDITVFTRVFRVQFPKGKIISITGSNGKSTTVSLLYEVLKSQNIDVYLGGNIGVSPLDFIADIKTDTPVVVLETSSYQLEYVTSKDYFDIAAILNLSDNHLDRYHGKKEEYAKAKLGGIDKEQTQVIVNFDDDYSKKYILPNLVAKHVYGVDFEHNKTSNVVTLENNSLSYVDEDEKINYLPNVEQLHIKGVHNIYNSAFVCVVLYLLDIQPSINLSTAFYNFAGLLHRIQSVAVIDGVEYVNDSKSTSPDATIKALEALGKNKNVVLISGGQDKDIVYDSMIESWQESVKSVVFLPGNAEPKLHIIAQKSDVEILGSVQTMNDAVICAREHAEAGDIVLLSPSTASFASFKSFEDRGNQFIECVQNLKK